MPPKVLAKNNDRANGVLPVTAATRAAATTKGPAPRLKLEIRRLPPGLTLTEFEETLGDEWKLGNGKVDWREYKQGKVKLGLGKMPEQSRCYIHVANEGLVKDLEQRFLAVIFTDKAGTHKNPDLKHLPPVLEFAMNQRTPLTTKARVDSRQGTIDQDPEFMTFLMAETEPITKAAALDAVGVEKKEGDKVEVKTTPLIEALRDKKANKAKAAESKAAEKKDAKGHARTESKDAVPAKADAKDDKNAKQKVDQASKEAVKALNKQVANKQQQAQQRPASPLPPTAKNASPAKTKKAAQNTSQSPKPQNATPTQPGVKNAPTGPAAAAQTPGQRPPREPRQRGGVDGIKKMLQKDLGIKPKPAPTAGQPGSAGSSTPASPAPNNRNTQQQKQPASPAPAAPANMKTPPTAPKAQQQAQPVPTAHLTKAYLKHAIPSQGMTEMLIQQALSQYGQVKSVTIDPRKGTAIALFKDNESLKKAIEAKRVPVAQGTVEILEFKDRPAGGGPARGGFRGGRGGRGGARGGAQSAASSVPPAAAPAASKPNDGA
ncbi:hypothetical protein CLAFUW4_12427 [Fulvia fulva]|uniref:Uncharacterized protein n=1 Tax=Passalora fulva TaxID=5499 RepID=A0A9Q8PDP1_PASFU|nr:uncharacterized protein CLAFUR5_11455 [Fulvia fulva]KAK4619041.1 hypothetical protein CLAFUR0_12443 [Fulvia fulva]UJO20669.1 hypothetical protein CLAFUR5_11455 [Fulvia fulva]WPV18371.1 hypothetical protein CLAFUW4_12427 [Fulvia fulva]WPV33330.1 hypothetical protein CLAFUW7_12434 [Fulvia fulva]